MNLTFSELKCPKCGEPLQQGSITSGVDVSMVKRCAAPDCGFWMIIVIPHKDYDYQINKTLKEEGGKP